MLDSLYRISVFLIVIPVILACAVYLLWDTLPYVLAWFILFYSWVLQT